MQKTKRKITPVQLIVLGYLVAILLCTLLLLLPWSTVSRNPPDFMTAFFTAVSACSVTGLILQETALYWSIYGQIVLLIFIQIGGVGFITIIISFIQLVGKKVGLFNRTVMQEAVNTPNLKGMVRLVRMIIIGTVGFELLGAILLSFRFIPDYGWALGIWVSIFTSISAFCNAGFDIMAVKAGGSMYNYLGDPIVCLVLPFLIFIGGIGFYVWRDIWENKFSFKKYSLHTKLVLITTLILIVIPNIIFLSTEWNNPLFKNNFGKFLLTSFFTSITPRTAGFTIINLNYLHTVNIFMIIILMLIGGNSGSTAGGVKTTSASIFILIIWSKLRGKQDVESFKRRLDDESIANTGQIMAIFVLLTIIGVLLMTLFEPALLNMTPTPPDSDASLTVIFFEVISALSNTGLSLGVTPQLGIDSQILLCILMFIGRTGCITFMLSLRKHGAKSVVKKPQEKVHIG